MRARLMLAVLALALLAGRGRPEPPNVYVRPDAHQALALRLAAVQGGTAVLHYTAPDRCLYVDPAEEILATAQVARIDAEGTVISAWSPEAVVTGETAAELCD